MFVFLNGELIRTEEILLCLLISFASYIFGNNENSQFLLKY